jgi:hypothetical protein
LLAAFPAASQDLDTAIVSCGFDPEYFVVTIEPMTKYKHAADDLLNDCFDLASCGEETHDDHMQRIETIVSRLTRFPDTQYPIFRIGHPEDDAGRQVQCWDITEGLHRLVAFQKLDPPTVPVIWITYE